MAGQYPPSQSCYNCGSPSHFLREYPHRSFGRGHATGANTTPLALPAPAGEVPNMGSFSRGYASRSGFNSNPSFGRPSFWRLNQEKLDRCYAKTVADEEREAKRREEEQRQKTLKEEEERKEGWRKERERLEAEINARLDKRMEEKNCPRLKEKSEECSLREELDKMKKENDRLRRLVTSGDGVTDDDKEINVVASRLVLRTARASPKPRWTDNIRKADKWKQEYARMKEMHRGASLEAEVLKEKCAVAEGEVVKLKEQLNKAPAAGTGQRGEGGGTNLKTRLDAVAVRSTRKGLKATPRQDLGDGGAVSGGVNERFQYVEAQKKDLHNYKKSGLEMLCREAGLKPRAIELMIQDLAEHRVDKAFGSNSNEGKEADKEILVHEVSEDSPPIAETSESGEGCSTEL
ncbi:hypothetical protein CBR_g30990 [Chara braunii]|uniref:CCHC-type domain-containing protein n=1 Tax=Chara braunii TaxID=69332 RepID=A0A388LDZ4_CHABU|nr:hypothetical protein CBR_g30990 [Chara braunii]|eukprot:GBG80529.1 hypothetical protein CBR_g30990 [Chara braunii]